MKGWETENEEEGTSRDPTNRAHSLGLRFTREGRDHLVVDVEFTVLAFSQVSPLVSPNKIPGLTGG